MRRLNARRGIGALLLAAAVRAAGGVPAWSVALQPVAVTTLVPGWPSGSIVCAAER